VARAGGNSFAEPDWIDVGGGDESWRSVRDRKGRVVKATRVHDVPPAHFPPLADDDPDDTPRRSARSRAGASLRAVDDAVPNVSVPSPSLDVDDGGGFLFGCLLYTLVLNYLRFGPDGVKSWLKAKLINKPTMARGANAQPAAAATPVAGHPVRTA
jgi:hypothetical protein